MIRLPGLLAGALLVVALAPSTAAAAPPAGAQRVIVQVVPGTDVEALASAQVRAGGSVRHVYAEVLDGFAATLPAQPSTRSVGTRGSRPSSPIPR